MFSPSEYGRVWEAIYNTIKESGELSSTALDFLFKNTRIIHIEADFIVLAVENQYKQNSLQTRYAALLSNALISVFGMPMQTDIIVHKPTTPLEGEDTVISPLKRSRELLEEEEMRKLAAETATAFPAGERRLSYNSDYTFENFIVGSSNRMAHAAAQAVANNPSYTSAAASSYNPLFIYGPSGLGKTHLMYAITNKLFEKSPDMNAIYINGEDFTTQLIEAISRKTTAAFREKYRKADMLLIDDIQFIAGKESTQEEFFHTFNALYNDRKQIILTSDRPPRDMVTLEERIRTRFEQGLIVDIHLPDYELRLAILKNKAESMNLVISDEMLAYIAERLQSNIRQLEGIIKRISATHILDGAKIDMNLVRSLVPMFQQDTEPVGETVEKIVCAVAKRYGVSAEEIMGKARTKEIKDARNIAMYIIRQMTDLSLPAIGTTFNRDHTTIHSNIGAVEKQIKTTPSLEQEITEIIHEIKR